MEQGLFFQLVEKTGIYHLSMGNFAMWIIAVILITLAIKKNYEPLLLVPIGFGILLSNIPLAELMKQDHLLWVFYHYSIEKWDLIPPIIFMGVGAMTVHDHPPLDVASRASKAMVEICRLDGL